jgi:hypothetical protein
MAISASTLSSVMILCHVLKPHQSTTATTIVAVCGSYAAVVVAVV